MFLCQSTERTIHFALPTKRRTPWGHLPKTANRTDTFRDSAQIFYKIKGKTFIMKGKSVDCQSKTFFFRKIESQSSTFFTDIDQK